MKGLSFLSKMVKNRVRVWTSGRSLPMQNFLENTPPPPSTPLGLATRFTGKKKTPYWSITFAYSSASMVREARI